MFYMKRKGEKLEICEDNVFTVCSICGREHPINLVELAYSFPDWDLYGTYVYCPDCSKKIIENRRRNEG